MGGTKVRPTDITHDLPAKRIETFSTQERGARLENHKAGVHVLLGINLVLLFSPLLISHPQDFDPVDYINTKFPSEQIALEALDPFIGQITEEIGERPFSLPFSISACLDTSLSLRLLLARIPPPHRPWPPLRKVHLIRISPKPSRPKQRRGRRPARTLEKPR